MCMERLTIFDKSKATIGHKNYAHSANSNVQCSL